MTTGNRHSDIHRCRAFARMLAALAALLLLGISQLSAQQPCPVPDGYTGNPLSKPSISAREVESNPTVDNLREFAVAARDYALSIRTQLELAYASCLWRQEGGDWRSGEIYPVSLSINPEVLANPAAPVRMRVIVHSADMAISGKLLQESTAREILTAAARDPASGGEVPSVACQALGCPEPGVGGHAILYGPYVMLVGSHIREPHLGPEVLDIGQIPDVTASDVIDRATLKDFVGGAIDYIDMVFKTQGLDAASALRGVLRDENGPWRAGEVYLFISDRIGYTVFHAAFPDKFELIPSGVARDAATGELILPRVIAAATGNDEGGFVEYNFDNPADDLGEVGVPKLTYVREYTFTFTHPYLGEVTNAYIVGAGLYPGQGPDGGPKMTRGCADRDIAASAIRTESDVRAFVECAQEYLVEHGTSEARRAFNEDERWKHGPIYVFVGGIAKSGTESMSFVYPPDPTRQGKVWGESINDFGTDYYFEVDRILQAVDSGWIYYTYLNPATGRRSPKASYIAKVDWDGVPAALGAGIYSRDWPGACEAEEVSASALRADPSLETLREFVRCAAMVVESEGYFAKEELEGDERWTDGEHYVYVLDMHGNQVMSGNGVRINGRSLHEWGRGLDQFGGRDMVDVGRTFGETYVYYRWHNPRTGAVQPRVGFLKRVVAQGVPLLVGAGYTPGPGQVADEPGCADNYATASAVRTQADVPAFVRCAAEYIMEHGEEEARRAFNEDERWKAGPTYLFVDAIQPSGRDAMTFVYPPQPLREGMLWGESIDGFGSDYFHELHRILGLVDEGWIYYAFDNPVTGRRQPKSSYVIEIDWNGERAAIGAGVYGRDFPGACDPADVNAADLAANPSDQRLREFVRCAALEVESSGYFAAPVLSSDPRWRDGPIYIFGINTETGVVEFSGNPASFATSRRIPELLFGGRDAIESSALFGESFWYYNFNNPATGGVAAKVSFLKLVRAQGVPLLVGSGYNP